MNNNLEKECNILLYKSKEGNINLDVILKSETIWLSQKSIAKLFNCITDNISLHLKNIFKDKELEKKQIKSMKNIELSKISYILQAGMNYI